MLFLIKQVICPRSFKHCLPISCAEPSDQLGAPTLCMSQGYRSISSGK